MPSLVKRTSYHHIRSRIVLIPEKPLRKKHQFQISEDLLHACGYRGIPYSYHLAFFFAGAVILSITISLIVRYFWSSSAG